MAQVERHSDGSADADGALIAVTGELDIATATILDQVLDRAIEGRPAPHVIIDLRDVTFIDCAALGVLLRARNRLGDRFWLRSVPPAVTRLLDLTDVFAVRDQDAYLRPPDSQECNLSTTAQALGDARQEQAQSGAPCGSRGACAPAVHDPVAPRVAITDAGRLRCIVSSRAGGDCTVVNLPHTHTAGGVVALRVNRSAAAAGGSQVATRQDGPVEVRGADIGRRAGTGQCSHRLTGSPSRRVPGGEVSVVALSVGGVGGGVGEGCC